MIPRRITVDTNPDVCNLHCRMCDTHSIYNPAFEYCRKTMPKDMLLKILDDAGRIGVKEIIPTTMGEPLLYNEFDLFIAKVKEYNMKLNLTTNGTFPNGGIDYWGEKILEVASDVKVSLNGIRPAVNENIMRGADTLKALNNICRLVEIRDTLIKKHINNPTITLQITFMKSNLDEIENIIKFAVENKINRVKGHQLWVTWDELKEESLSSGQKLTEKWNKLVDTLSVYKNKINLENFSKLEKCSKQDSISDNFECPFLGKELWVDYDGTYNVCCAPSKLRKKLGDFNSIQNKNIKTIFNSEEYLTLVNNYKNKFPCKTCLLRRPA